MSTLETIKKISTETNNINEKNIGTIKEIQLDKLSKNPLNFYDENYALDDLKESILNFGLIEPLIINANYQILSGHRRFTAMTELGFTSAKCVIQSEGDYLDQELLLIEANRQRIKTKEEKNYEIKRLHELYTEKKKADPNFKGNINELIASSMNVSTSTVKRALKDTKNQSETIQPQLTKSQQQLKKLNNLIEKILQDEELDIQLEQLLIKTSRRIEHTN